MTRAGYEGSIDTDKLKEYSTTDFVTNGFGVFAYYTGKSSYGGFVHTTSLYKDETDYAGDPRVANFMFNQQVYWNGSLSDQYVTKWTYSPIKYWPNEISAIANKPDDDQIDDAGNDPATGSGEYGGNVSFFAYAPYVEITASGLNDNQSTTDTDNGIIAFNGKTTLTEANAVEGDPKLTYVINFDGGKIVDLLWGTTWNNGKGVTEAANSGVTSTADLGGTSPDEYVVTNTINAETYQKEILRRGKGTDPNNFYTVNADLTKQKTTGTVGFAFKHALAKVGGSGTTVTTSSGTTTTTTTSGLQIMLDIDDMMGAETGGTKGAETKVTVKSISIEAYSLSAKAETTSGGTTTTTYTYLKKAQGDFNLATGKWDVLTTSNTTDATSTTTTPPAIPASDVAKTTHTIVPDYETGSAILNDNIAEAQYSAVTGDTWGWGTQPEGVLITPQTVYKDEANPLVFIPGTYPDLKVTIDYIVRTKDNNLMAGSSYVGQKITKRLTFADPVQLNKQYSLVMRLGLTSVKFTATVDDWEPMGTTTTTDDGEGNVTITQTTESAEIYLPRNVKGPVVSNFAIQNNESTPANITSVTAGDGTKDVIFTITGTKKKDDAATATALDYSDIQVISAPSWITFTSTSSEHKISFDANSTNATRTGNIVLSIKDAANPEGATYTISVKQYGKLQVATTATNFAATSVTNEAFVSSVTTTDGTEVLSTATFAVTSGGSDLAGASVNTSGQISLPYYTGTTNREIKVNITATVDGETLHSNEITITQGASALTIAGISGNQVATGVTDGGPLTINDAAWASGDTGTSDMAWLTVNNTDGKVNIAANKTPQNRTATVTVKRDDATGTISITQSAGSVVVSNVTVAAGATVVLPVTVGGDSYLLKNATTKTYGVTNSSSTDVTSDFTITEGAAQNTISPKNTVTAGTYTLSVKLDDATEATATITVN